MPPVPRLQLTSEFRAAVFADPRGVVRLAHTIGMVHYPALSRMLHAPRIAGTALKRDRLRKLAEAIHFTGEVFVVKTPREVFRG